jgi:hypothetical protein
LIFFRQPCSENLHPATKQKKKRLPTSTSAAIPDEYWGYVNVTKVICSKTWLSVTLNLVSSYLQLRLPGLQDGIGLPSAIAMGTAADTMATTLSNSTAMRRAFFM